MENNEIDEAYIDVSDALKRLGGNAALYKKLLTSFLSSDYLDTLKAQIETGDLVSAERTAHTIKGVTGNLSLKKLFTASAELDQQLKESNYESLPEFELIMAQTLQYITSYINSN